MVEIIGREEFVTNRFDYNAGEHVTFIGYTQSGKTTLAFELLDEVTSKELQAVVLVMKPKDKVPDTWKKKLKYRRIRDWPPTNASPNYPNRLRPRGWVLWPKLGDIDEDDVILRRVFRHALKENYSIAAHKRAPGRIIFADEIVGLDKELGLDRELKAIYMRGSGMGVGMWAATQRPFEAPLFCYNAARHLFLHHDTDRRNIDRYRQIGGGFDPDKIQHITMNVLEEHQFLYLRKGPKAMCIVDSN